MFLELCIPIYVCLFFQEPIGGFYIVSILILDVRASSPNLTMRWARPGVGE